MGTCSKDLALVLCIQSNSMSCKKLVFGMYREVCKVVQLCHWKLHETKRSKTAMLAAANGKSQDDTATGAMARIYLGNRGRKSAIWNPKTSVMLVFWHFIYNDFFWVGLLRYMSGHRRHRKVLLLSLALLLLLPCYWGYGEQFWA